MRTPFLPLLLLIAWPFSAPSARAALPAPPASALSPRALNLVIDPGHGGADHGAVYGGQKEATLTLLFAEKLKERLRDDARFNVLATRDRDQTLSLPQRVKMAEDFRADLFVSLHLNASADSRAKGAQFFFQNHLPLEVARNRAHGGGATAGFTGELSQILGDLVRQNRQFESLGFIRILHEDWFKGTPQKGNSNIVRQAPFYVVSKTTMPSVLIEIGFISHAKEAKLLAQADYQEQITGILQQSLTNYYDHFKKGLSSPENNPK